MSLQALPIDCLTAGRYVLIPVHSQFPEAAATHP